MADGYALRFDGVAYPAEAERLFHSILAMPASTTRARSGIRAGGGLVVTVGGGPEAATVSTGGGIITDTTAGLGSWFFVVPSSVSKNLSARPAAGQTRLDEVVARINTTTKEVEIAVITGTATSGTPTAPTIPAGNLRLAELLVPASGSVTVQKPAQRTASLGGILPVASQAERDAIEVIYDGLIVYREDTDTWEGRQNGAWVPLRMKVDSGWTTLASALASGGIRYRRVDDEVWVQVDGAFTTISGTDYTVSTGTIPLALRPTPPVGTSYQSAGVFGGRPGVLLVNTDGEVHMSQQTGASWTTVRGLLKYPLG